MKQNKIDHVCKKKSICLPKRWKLTLFILKTNNKTNYIIIEYDLYNTGNFLEMK